MADLIPRVGDAILTDGGLSAFILFFALVASNVYHIRTSSKSQAQNREDIAAAWAMVNKISETTNTTLANVNMALALIRDRLERR